MANQQRNFIVYKSSAGSGKTFTLVREYLKIVLQNPESFRQVLAITFTNKAANEMKDRVVSNLIVLADEKKDPDSPVVKFMLPQLAEQLKLPPELIRTRAAQVLQLIMHHYSEFSVSTIDSFTHRVIRTFAHDLKIPMNFEVELDAGNMLSQAVDLLISQAGTDDKLTQIMVDFVEKKADDELNWQIEKDLNDFGRNLLSEASIEAVKSIRNYEIETFMKVRQSLLQWKISWEKNLAGLASEIMGLFAGDGLAAEFFIQKDRGIFGYIRNLSEGRTDKIKPNSYAEKAFKTGEWINPKSPSYILSSFDAVSAKIFSSGEKIFGMVENELSRYILCKILLNNIYSTALLIELEKALKQLCDDGNKLLISEFNRRISEVVREQPAPFIYERLGERFHHFLIDEFQDTSVLQWQNLLPLIENSLASSQMNLVVGDAKQAIYRWRSGDAEQFEMLPELLRDPSDAVLEDRENALKINYMEENLVMNHRSSPVVVEFNNRFFTSIATTMPGTSGEPFTRATQEAAKKEKPGMVRIVSVASQADEEESYDELVFKNIYRIIRELKEDQFQYKDIAILCRINDKASRIAAFLIRQGIPVISSESLLLTQSEQVNFLIAWIRHLSDPSDAIQMVHILQYIQRKNPDLPFDDDLVWSVKEPLNTHAFLINLKDKTGFSDYDLLKNLDLFGLIQFLIFHYKFNELKDSYLQFFQDAVLEFIKNKGGGLQEFLDWWEKKSESYSVIIPEGINAVRIMTIHKAKGLQFPVVIYPYADDSLRSTLDNIWVALDEPNAEPLKTACLPLKSNLADTVYNEVYQREMQRSCADLVNVLYVALTRPEERLYVLLGKLPEKTEDPVSVPKLFSRFLMEENLWGSGKDSYQFGERWKKSIDPDYSAEEIEDENVPFSRPLLKMLFRHHAPSVWDMENPEQNREWGNMVHMVMSGITADSSPDKLLDEVFSEGLISSAQKNDLADLIHTLLDNPEISRFFKSEGEILNEAEIITPDGHLYRPDRVLLNQGKATVIDFKTGSYNENHRTQVLKYVELLTEMNYLIEGAYLVYLNRNPELKQVV